MFPLLKKPGCLVRWSHFLRFLVGSKLRKAFLEILLSLDVLSVFAASGRKACIFDGY